MVWARACTHWFTLVHLDYQLSSNLPLISIRKGIQHDFNSYLMDVNKCSYLSFSLCMLPYNILIELRVKLGSQCSTLRHVKKVINCYATDESMTNNVFSSEIKIIKWSHGHHNSKMAFRNEMCKPTCDLFTWMLTLFGEIASMYMMYSVNPHPLKMIFTFSRSLEHDF